MPFWTRFAIHTVIVAIGLGLFLRTLYGRARALQSVKWTNLFDKIPERIQALLVIGFGQKKFLIDQREKSAGWMHFFIFWGFTILGVRVTTAFAQGWFGPDFHLPLLGVDMLGGPYLLLKDLIEVFVLVSISPTVVAAYDALQPGGAPQIRPDQVLSALASSSVTGALFASAAAWYRRFLALSSPRRAPAGRSPQRKSASR